MKTQAQIETRKSLAKAYNDVIAMRKTYSLNDRYHNEYLNTAVKELRESIESDNKSGVVVDLIALATCLEIDAKRKAKALYSNRSKELGLTLEAEYKDLVQRIEVVAKSLDDEMK